ncbi:AAA family ATPase [Jannaschia aquimarina]|uniref:YhaN AAA domain-containing protein n=1 Tax=Jannaschia aquimarina TaxID=935700 RepID=A0A0D1EGH6_9RHOB|nr:AAA family ATPase [Jannaschia aquimarina]KIT14950.1 hypothetical protein jaqu_32750 [Jannaschia aquimarina]SNS60216.1 Uncharacterized protein YhaN [Jannaschia aquimarina]
MRVSRLDLVRYGHLEGVSLDFGPARECDVTVIYGDNEAGKSTLYEAWLDLLFGIPMRSDRTFRFDRRDLEITASLDTDDGVISVRRIGRGLLDSAGHPLDESWLHDCLPSGDRDAFRKRFSLDDQTLRAGGEEIASGHGDLGSALHVGTSGTLGVADALDELGKRVDAFHKKRGRSTRLAEAKSELKDLAERLKDSAVTPPAWDTLTEAVTEAERRVELAREGLACARMSADLYARATRIRSARADVERLNADLAELPAGSDLPAGAEVDVNAALTLLDTVREGKAVHEHAIAEAQAILDRMPEDEEGLRIADEMERIEGLRDARDASILDRAQTAIADLPEREKACAALLARRDAALARAGTSDLPALDREGLERIEAALRQAEAAQRDAGSKVADKDRAEAAIPPEVVHSGDRTVLDHALEAMPHPDELDRLTREAAAARDRAVSAAQSLPHAWRNLCDDLPEDETVEAALDRWRNAERHFHSVDKAADEARRMLDEAEAAEAALRARPDSVDETGKAAARQARDLAWDRHRASLSEATADRFAEAMRADDDAMRHFLKGAETRAALEEAQQRSARAGREAERAREVRDAAEAALAEARRVVDRLAQRLGDVEPSGLRARLARLRKALDADLTAERAERDLAKAKTRERVASEALAAALIASGGEIGPDLRLSAGQHRDRLIDAEKKFALREAALRRAAETRETAEEALRVAGMADSALRELLDGLFCADASLAELRTLLPDLGEALRLDEEYRSAVSRIETLRTDIARLDQAVAPLRTPFPEGDALTCLARARARAGEARNVAARRTEAKEAIAKASEELARLAVRAASADQKIEAVFVDQGGEGPPGIRLASLLDRDAKRRRVAELRGQIAEARQEVDRDALEAEIANMTPGRADILADDVVEAENALGAAREALGSARTKRDDALDGAGGDAARQARAALLADLRTEAREAVALRLGEMVARRALARHQGENRGRMLEAAQAAFARLTEGAWTRLETGPGDKGEALFAIGRGERTRVDQLSTGTRGQIYLALRLAGHAMVADPPPFVLDDIAETFDDSRARATLTMLGEIGARGQAILMTHHRHLVDMARETLPGVHLQELPARA